jgi:hypothetical protein
MGGVAAADLQKATLASLGFLFARVVTVEQMTRAIAESGAA